MTKINKGDKVKFNKEFEVTKVRQRTATITIDGIISLEVDKEYISKIK